jgi:hypothetical protein
VPPFKRRGELILYYNFLLLVEESLPRLSGEYPGGGGVVLYLGTSLVAYTLCHEHSVFLLKDLS